MAAAAMHAHLPSSNALPTLGSNLPAQGVSETDIHIEGDKAPVANLDNDPRPLSPGSIAEDPRNKKLGMSSKTLRVQDFELLKTLGTGGAASRA